MKTRNLALSAVGFLAFASAALAQTSSLEGDVKGEDGNPAVGAWVKIDRTDIKGAYKVKTDKKGHYFHAGLPLGMYVVSVEIDGQVKDTVKGVRTRLGDPTPVNFDLYSRKQKDMARQKAAAAGKTTISKEESRSMSAEEREKLQAALKQQEGQMRKNKELNDAFNAGMTALQAKDYGVAVTNLAKAAEFDPKQNVVWAQLAEAYMGQALTKTGADQGTDLQKGLDAYVKAIEIKPDDAAYHNNYALALVKAKKISEAQAELTKAAQLNPAGAGQYFYNLGAVLTNTGQLEPAAEAFKRAYEADPNYAEAYYQYGISLMGGAKMTPDGKIVPPPGAQESFEKYLQLKADGPNAEAAKAMIATLGGSVEVLYKNPKAPEPKGKKTTTKKK
jgi:tetratricopeptide (TPR) repeat protein